MAVSASFCREKWTSSLSIFRFYLLSPPVVMAKRSRETCINGIFLRLVAHEA